MSEYVVDFGDKSSAFVGLAMAEAESHGATLKERIVRCRDCKYVTDEGYGCKYFSHYEQGASYRWEDVPAEVEPDGLCAWGERRESE